MRRRKQKTWTEADNKLMRRLFQLNADDAEFQRALGRTKQSAYTHKAYLKRLEAGLPSCHSVHVSARPDDETLRAAQQRIIADRSTTAWLFGDPAPGYREARAEIERQAKIVKDELHRKAALARHEDKRNG